MATNGCLQAIKRDMLTAYAVSSELQSQWSIFFGKVVKRLLRSGFSLRSSFLNRRNWLVNDSIRLKLEQLHLGVRLGTTYQLFYLFFNVTERIVVNKTEHVRPIEGVLASFVASIVRQVSHQLTYHLWTVRMMWRIRPKSSESHTWRQPIQSKWQRLHKSARVLGNSEPEENTLM